MSTVKQQEITDLLIVAVQRLPAFSNLPSTAQIVLNQVIEKAAAKTSVDILKGVGGFVNNSFDTIPKNLVGNKNPLDLISKNNSPSSITNFLTPEAASTLTPQISSDFVGSIISGLKTQLNPSVLSKINFNNLTSSLNVASQKAVGQSVNTTMSSINQEIFSGKDILGAVLNPATVSRVFGQNASEALYLINLAFESGIVDKVLKQAGSFKSNTPKNQEKLLTQTKGFIDPNAKYPTEEYKNLSETNKLATGDVKGTIVQTKENERSLGNQLPDNEFWEQPPVPYKGQYPYNKVTQTESGHIIEMDDTPGAERLQIYHRSGTFIEIDSNGSIVKKTKGSSYEIIEKNGYISVTGDAAVSVKGSVKVFVAGDANIEVEGDTNIKCFNDITMQAAGRIDMSATEEINMRSANINIEADVNFNMKADVNTFLTTKDYYFKANNNSYSQILKNQYEKIGESKYTQVVTNNYLKVGSSIFNQAGSQVHYKSGGTFNVDGSATYLQSGTASSSSDSQDSKYALSANIGLLGTRKDIVTESIADPVSQNFTDEDIYKIEDSESKNEVNNQRQLLKKKGIATDSDFNIKAAELDSNTPTSKINTIIKPDSLLLQQNYLPENYQLSTHFTVGDLTTKTAVTKNKLVAQSGLTYGEIAYNLSATALNILEPLLALYPNIIITSAFRLKDNSSSLSEHPKGKAVDIQIPEISKSEYFEVAKKIATNLNYDKLILQYRTYGTQQPSIHISFDVNKNRKQVQTYYNDSKYSNKLSKLA